MCGIAGALGSDAADDGDAVFRALRAQIHRGPDGESVRADGPCTLGQTRLAIIDRSHAGQGPLSNEDGTVWVTYNGEIYNFAELRKELESHGHTFRSRTDTEVLVHAYEQWGMDAVHRFRGMFAFALWDSRRKRLWLVRDRVGKKPLFFAATRERLCFASELQGIKAFGEISRDVDVQAISAYLSWGYVPAPKTGLIGIEKLPPGCWMTADVTEDGLRTEKKRYWSLEYRPKRELREEEASELVRGKLTDAVRLRMVSDVPLGAFLSGGIDSSIVVGLMAAVSPEPVKTFSIGFQQQSFNELEHARRIADLWQTDHHEYVVEPDVVDVVPMLARHYGEPFADSSAIPTYYVSKMTSDQVTVALNGDGGDESFAGYERYWANAVAERLQGMRATKTLASLATRLLPASNNTRSSMARIRRFGQAAFTSMPARYGRWQSYFPDEEKRRLCSAAFADASAWSTRWFEGLFDDTEDLQAVDAAMSVDVRSYLPYDLLVKVDIASMANSLEARSPFLDQDVMEFAARLPVHLKIRGRRSKYLLRTAFSDLLPSENVRRRKMGFAVPVGDWLRGELRDLLFDCLLSQQALARGYFRSEEVQRLVDEHVERRADHSARLWNLLMLEMWHREVVETSASGATR